MIKSELILRVADRTHLYKKDVERVVDTILNEIEATLARADRVELRGFGAFTVKTWSTRPGRNPKTGDPINVPETRHPSFRTGKEMRDRLNGPPEAHCAPHSTKHNIHRVGTPIFFLPLAVQLAVFNPARSS
jgi:integration host factor subunit beta